VGGLGGLLRPRPGGRGHFQDHGEVIRADRRSESAVDDREVGRQKGVVDRDPIPGPGRPARLPPEAEPAIPEPRSPEEPAEMRRAVGAVQVPDHQGRSLVPLDPPGEGVQLAADRQDGGPLEGRDVVDQPELAGAAIEVDDGVDRGIPARKQGRGGLDSDRRGPEPEGQAPAFLVVGVLEAMGILRADRLQAGQPVAGHLDQADDVGPLPADQADQGFPIGIVDQNVGHQNAEPRR